VVGAAAGAVVGLATGAVVGVAAGGDEQALTSNAAADTMPKYERSFIRIAPFLFIKLPGPRVAESAALGI
jgi:hypothetical protein